MASLHTVEIPGYREAVKRERTLRDRAFLGGNEMVAGIVVRPLSLRTVLYLEHAENGFMIPFRFDDDMEVLAHALQVLYFSSPKWKAPEVRASLFAKYCETIREERFKRKVLKCATPRQVVIEVREWINEAFMDCPQGGGSDAQQSSYASYPATLLDLFAAAGLPFSYAEILDMPLKCLWQHWRVAGKRLYDMKLTNPSDEVAVNHIARNAA